MMKSVIAASLLAGAALMMAPQMAMAQLTVQSEEAAHPNLVRAIHEMQNALRALERAPDNFGGHKGQAMNDLRAAIHSTKRALYYRLNMDDNAIDRIP